VNNYYFYVGAYWVYVSGVVVVRDAHPTTLAVFAGNS